MLALVLALAMFGPIAVLHLGAGGPLTRVGGPSEEAMTSQEFPKGRLQVTFVLHADGVDRNAPWIEFRDSMVLVFGGCNEFAMDIERNPDGSFLLSEQPEPLINVCDVERMEVEKRLIWALSSARTARVEAGGALTLMGLQGALLRAAPVN